MIYHILKGIRSFPFGLSLAEGIINDTTIQGYRIDCIGDLVPFFVINSNTLIWEESAVSISLL